MWVRVRVRVWVRADGLVQAVLAAHVQLEAVAVGEDIRGVADRKDTLKAETLATDRQASVIGRPPQFCRRSQVAESCHVGGCEAFLAHLGQQPERWG